MALPNLTAAQRAEALKKATAVRKERSEILATLKDGKVSLREVLERGDTVVGKTYVRRLLESLPGIGKVRAGQLLDDLGIDERRRVQGLGARQKERLLELFQPQG
ncbi:integration host factor, actinobacterial type [Streptomyces sp. 2R]|uniref:integration host factor, actinobacterial type n=1 Tax=Streptomyces sp. 2R TaxID=1883452 RepID=UPI000B916DED|nr:integration host factor, actinobacterial type [Streptomyces sp. 2R]OXY96376.1 integration host factor [Streptomyces sp. 2R]